MYIVKIVHSYIDIYNIYLEILYIIATIKFDNSKDIKPSVNNVINKINELLTEGGRHVTIYNKYRGRNEEYVIQVKSQ